MQPIDELTTLYDEFTAKVKEYVVAQTTALEEKRTQIALEKKDKLLLDQREQALTEREQELQKREEEVEKAIQLNRERTKTLELKESRLTQERERLKNTLVNLNLEEN